MHIARCAVLAAAGLLSAAPAAAEEFDVKPGARALEPITYRNLTVVPVVSTLAQPPNDDYVVLDEGMKAGTVKIVEKGDGEVNELTLVNRSDKPLFLMAGEVIIGGKQDRIIGKDTVIPPKKRIAVPVYCVEHGRWTGRKAEFRSTGTLAHSNLRVKAKYHSQQDVWSEVSDKNSKRATENSTDTYRTIATGEGGVKGSISGYEKHFSAALGKVEKRDRIVGFVVAVNGEVVGIDLFGSPKLFRKLSGKLLRSYYVQAVDLPVAKAQPKVEATKVHAFIARPADKKPERVYENDASTTEMRKGGGVSTSRVKPKGAPEDAPAVYESVEADE